MVYLAIKELATTAEDVIMVTSSIMKDMQPNSEVIYRPNAIRALCKIIDVCVYSNDHGPLIVTEARHSLLWPKVLNVSSKLLSSTRIPRYLLLLLFLHTT